jgi:very-short-patch-repair endonuclease
MKSGEIIQRLKSIVDFLSFEKRIVIEIDGGQHAENLGGFDRRSIHIIMTDFPL